VEPTDSRNALKLHSKRGKDAEAQSLQRMVHDLELQLATVEASAALEAASSLGQVHALQEKVKELELARDEDREQLHRYECCKPGVW
jgi:hypothetical protein